MENKIQIYKANRSGRGEMVIAIMGALFFSVIMGCLFDLIVGLVTILGFIIFILIKRKKIVNSHDEVFYMNRKFIKCLAPKNNDYKGYALSPMSFSKIIEINKIESFHFFEKYFLIVYQDKIIHPRELDKTDIDKIFKFVKQYFPNLIKFEINEKVSKKENEIFLIYLLIGSVFIIGYLIIYFFGDNGHNVPVSISVIILMLLFPVFLVKYLNRNGKKK